MASLLKDPLIRRFISAAFFAGAFVWVAVYFFDVDVEVVRVLFIYSVGFVLLMIFAGLFLAPVLAIFRRKRSSLLEGEISNIVAEDNEISSAASNVNDTIEDDSQTKNAAKSETIVDENS